MATKEYKRYHFIAAFIALLVLMFLTVSFCRREAQLRKNEASTLLSTVKESILLNLQDKFNYTDELAAVLFDDDWEEHFEETANHIMKNPACVYVAVINKTELTDIYPPENNFEMPIGADITQLDYAFTLARLHEQLVVEGPVSQGGCETLLTILPIYDLDINENKIFLGEAVVALDNKYVVNSLNLERLTEIGYDYELWRIHPLDGSKNDISFSSNRDFSDAIEVKFELPTICTLSVIPKSGWYDWRMIATLSAISLALSIIVGVIVCLLQRNISLNGTVTTLKQIDSETNFLSREGFANILKQWINHKEDPFSLIYVVINNYNRFTQLCTPGQKSILLEHIKGCLNDFVESEHIIARIGECNFVLAIKDDCSFEELENLKKGLAIELLCKFILNDDRIFLTAECGSCKCPVDGSSPEDLLTAATKNYYSYMLSQNPAHDLTEKCERIINGESNILFGEYSDIEMNHLAKSLTRYRKSMQTRLNEAQKQTGDGLKE